MLASDTRVGRPRQSQCPKGHALAGQNVYVDPKGRRECRRCVNRRQQRYQARREAGQRPRVGA